MTAVLAVTDEFLCGVACDVGRLLFTTQEYPNARLHLAGSDHEAAQRAADTITRMVEATVPRLLADRFWRVVLIQLGGSVREEAARIICAMLDELAKPEAKEHVQ